MSFIENMHQKAKEFQGSLVLPEGTEPRTIAAAQQIIDKGLARSVYLIGPEAEVNAAANKAGVSLKGVEIIDPSSYPKIKDYAAELYQLRKHKGMTEAQAAEEILQ
ncbi:MAG: phosphate acetyltransferase, partial [Spirochaetaceae bacterium]